MAETNKAVPSVPEDEAQRQMRRLTRRSFTCGAAAALAGLAGWEWLRSRELEGGIPWPFRRVLEFNERLAQAYYRETRLAPSFSRAQAERPRFNGGIGLTRGFEAARWQLQVEGSGTPRTVTLDAIKALPRVELVTELKCIEGWSAVVHWAGARLADFIVQCPLATRRGQRPDLARPADLLEYVSLETPDGGYYVGLDRASALHPQTLLCYEMNGEPLPLEHGAPLRLVIPLKYGIKNIKRIGTIRFSDQRPADYWAERGYDWYAGH